MIAHRIIALRRKQGMSQAQLARKLHISASAEGKYEQGRRLPSVETLVLMANIFNVSLDYLITGHEYTAKSNSVHHEIADCPCNVCFWKNFK